MLILILFSFLLLIAYVVLMLQYLKGWRTSKPFVIAPGFQPDTFISIIVPARNEAANITDCIRSILLQNYPRRLYEVIVIDDHSTDDTAALVEQIQDKRVRCIRLAAHVDETAALVAYKKKALTIGIAAANGELIVTTDADCTAGANWLLNIAALYQQDNPVMIVAPVNFTNNGSIVQQFQSLDFMTMQGITASVHQLNLGSMSNGANLAFSKAAYTAVDGYNGIDHLASGDDYLLMMKLQQRYPNRISYLKATQAIVRTAPQPTWGSFLQQRIRWASKSGKYDDKKMTAMLMLVYLFNVSMIVLFVAGFFSPAPWPLLLFMLIVKTAVELVYLHAVAAFFNKQKDLSMFAVLQPLHIMYILLAGLLGFVGVYSWKGRKVK